jgi:hypothetical protein
VIRKTSLRLWTGNPPEGLQRGHLHLVHQANVSECRGHWTGLGEAEQQRGRVQEQAGEQAALHPLGPRVCHGNPPFECRFNHP